MKILLNLDVKEIFGMFNQNLTFCSDFIVFKDLKHQ